MPTHARRMAALWLASSAVRFAILTDHICLRNPFILIKKSKRRVFSWKAAS